jgi:hypothetical protein
MRLSRRDFIKAGIGGIALATMPSCASFLLSNPRHRMGKIALPAFNAGILRVYDWDRRTVSECQIPLHLTHSALQKKTGAHEVLVFDNVGPSCAVVDTGTMRPVRSLQRKDGHNFYGHGAMSADGKYVLCTEFPSRDDIYAPGLISIRDAESLQAVSTISSFGVHPHDLTFLEPDLIAVTNHGDGTPKARSNLSFISVKSGTLVNKIELNRERGNFGHLSPYGKDAVFVSCVDGRHPGGAQTKHLQEVAAGEGDAARAAAKKLRDSLEYHPAPMYLVGKDGSRVECWDESAKKSFRNNFSICRITGRQEAFATANGAADAVVIWKNLKVEKVLHFPGMYPSAVAASRDGSELVIGSSNGQIKFLETKNFTELPGRSLTLPGGPVHILPLT